MDEPRASPGWGLMMGDAGGGARSAPGTSTVLGCRCAPGESARSPARPSALAELRAAPLSVGTIHLEFHSSGNHYVWRKVTSTVHNIIVGKLWIDQVSGYGSKVMGRAWPRLAPGKGRGAGITLWGCLPGVPTALLL